MNIFQLQKNPNVPRNTFDLSHDVKLTFEMGELIPILCEETIPGDYWEIQTELLVKTLAMISPTMHLMECDIHHFYVTNEMMYDNFNDLLSPQEGDTPPLQPFTNGLHAIDSGDLGDYLDLPVDMGAVQSSETVLAYPIAAYAKIYDYYYRDQNLQAEAFTPLIANYNAWVNTLMVGPPLVRAWEHDYFTSALPWSQKGDIVTLPIVQGGSVDVTAKGAGNVSGTLLRGVSDYVLATADDVVVAGSGELHVGAQGHHTIDPNGDLEVVLNDVAQDIIAIRTAFKVQEFLELDARAGTRYKEMVYAHFDVKSKDGRLDEPEYIGGSKSSIQISEVLSSTQTLNSSNAVVNPVGERAGVGQTVSYGRKVKHYCREHGWIMSILSVRPRTAYQQGIPRKWSRWERLDYPFPMLAHIGEQPIYNREIYANQTTTAKMDEIFGYIPRYSEMKFINSRVCGLMNDSFDYWHLGRKFTAEPGLNSDFIECVPDKRIFAVETEPGLLAHVIFNIKCTRALPMFSTPGL